MSLSVEPLIGSANPEGNVTVAVLDRQSLEGSAVQVAPPASAYDGIALERYVLALLGLSALLALGIACIGVFAVVSYAAEARMQFPLDIHADPRHKSLWVADTYNNKIKRIQTKNKLVSSVPVDHRLDEPGGLAFNGDSLYIANTNFHEIVCLNLRNGKTQALNVNNDSL